MASEEPDDPNDEPAREVEPEPVEPRVGAHHPPPPPSMRSASGEHAIQSQPPGPRFELASTPTLVRDLMTRKLMTIEPNATLEHLEEHLENFRIGHLPVVEGDKLVGLITRNDLLHASSSFLSDHASERDVIIHKVQASRIMQRELITVGPDDTLAEVTRIMWEAKIGCVPVVEEGGKLVGLVTEADFLRVAHHFLKNQKR